MSVMSLDHYVIVVVLAGGYAVARERIRFTTSALLLLGLWVFYGAGYFYFASQVETWDHVSARVTLCLAVMWLGLVLGMELVRAVARPALLQQHVVMSSWEAVPVRGSADRSMALLAWLLCGLLIAGFVFFGRPWQVLEFLSAATEAERRELRFVFNQTGSYAYDVILAVFAPFICFYLLGQWLSTRRRLFLTACLALAGTIVLCKFATFQKLPWVFFLLQVLVAYRLTNRLSMNLAWLVGAVALGVLALGFAASIAYPEVDVPAIGNYLLYRSAYITNEGLYQTLYVYPDYLPHSYGYNVGLIQAVFGIVPREPAHTVVAGFFGSPESTYNALFIADAWVDFGIWGVLLIAIVVGSVVKLSDVFYFRFGKTPLCIAGVVASTWGVVQLLSTAAPTAFLSGGLVLLPGTIVALRNGSLGSTRPATELPSGSRPHGSQEGALDLGRPTYT